MPVKPQTDEEFEKNFWSRVDKTSDSQGCWLWTGYTRLGYGTVKRYGKQFNTHIVSYLLSGGIIPDGLVLCHSGFCVGKKNCCNPNHLTPKTQSENALDMHRDGTLPRIQRKLTDAQVLEIRASVGKSHSQLGKEYGVARCSITSLLNNRTYTHI